MTWRDATQDPISLPLLPEEVVALMVELAAAEAHAEIERMATDARRHINHVFGGLIGWVKRRARG